MSILIINAGSSSIKYQLFDTQQLEMCHKGLIEEISDHHEGFETMRSQLHDKGIDIQKIDAIGHRVVHGAEQFNAPVIITDAVIETLKKLIPLAPLHNPANIEGIEAARKLAPNIPNIAVFDTAFHQSMPDYAYRYPLPNKLYEELHVRRYGFHGSSHEYVATEAAKVLNRPLESLNLITLHIGNGASLCAIEKGKSVDTSMGMTPLEGVMMGTRSGSIDPAIITYLCESADMSIEAIDSLLNKESGLKAVAGTNDMREIIANRDAPNNKLALQMFIYRLKKQIGAYLAILPKTDAIVFTGGIGEHAVLVRELTCNALEHLGIVFDAEKNSRNETAFHSEKSQIKLLTIATNEELQIALHVKELLHQ